MQVEWHVYVYVCMCMYTTRLEARTWSLTYVRTYVRNESDYWDFCISSRPIAWEMFEHEHIHKDPKDGELCLRRMESGETQMEARSDTDVQIVRHTWV